MTLNPSSLCDSSIRPYSCQSMKGLSNYSFNRSKGEHDYRQLARINFPGGWGDQESTIFHWYRLQPYSQFQSIEYRKYLDGVQHEYILVLLQDDDGHPVNSCCRLERVADPAHRVEAIDSSGTSAFDFVQTVDYESCKASKLIAHITFPRAFNLLDILGICYGIQSHHKAKRYTLQQFNCYFFSWTVILCLARRAADWESIICDNIKKVQESIINHVDNIRSPDNLTAWALIFSQDNRLTTQNMPNMTDMFHSKLLSASFSKLVDKLVCPLLWCDNQDPNRFRSDMAESLYSGLSSVADEEVDHIFHNMRIQDIQIGQRSTSFVPEMARIFLTLWLKFYYDANYAQRSHEAKKSSFERTERSPLSPQVKKLGTLPRVRHEVLGALNLAIAILHSILFSIVLSWDAYDRSKATLRNSALWEPLHGPLSVGKVIFFIPSFLYTSFSYLKENRLYQDVSAGDIELRAQRGSSPHKRRTYEKFVHAMNESIKVYTGRYPTKNANELRDTVVETIQFFYGRSSIVRLEALGRGRITTLWKTGLRTDIASEISTAIIHNFVNPVSGVECLFEWSTENNTGGDSGSKSKPRRISHPEIQNIIRGRIHCLSKREVEFAPIMRYAQHIPFTNSPQESKEEMEGAIEDIWGLCGRLMAEARPDQVGSLSTSFE
ncbi:unnamed protein product [Rhizoctonia solani]|uniref:Uncharacterized protein n=1 Tax=Rhizoctonia solani TaxID=456999 RepID=A0A8H3CGK6_9AGAM|nr:unnamed protein product [Rhizoctonia solani]